MSNLIQHPYHLVNESPWPFLASLGALFITRGLASWFHEHSTALLYVGLALTTLVAGQWWLNISHEGRLQGKHSILVEVGLRYGIILFIVSEVLFFSSFFWMNLVYYFFYFYKIILNCPIFFTCLKSIM